MIQEVFNEEIILCYTVQEKDTQYFTRVHIILHGYGMQYNTKGVTKTLCFVLLSRRMTSFCANFQINCSHCLPVFAWLWPAL